MITLQYITELTQYVMICPRVDDVQWQLLVFSAMALQAAADRYTDTATNKNECKTSRCKTLRRTSSYHMSVREVIRMG